MLSAADAKVVRRDPRIPALPLLLDTDAFVETLAGLYPGAAITALEARYLRYKPGMSCLAGYRATTPAGTLEIYARAHNPAVAEKVEKAAQRDSVRSLLGGGIGIAAEQALVIYPFPNDHELPALRRLGERGTGDGVIRELLPDRPDLWDGTLEGLRYKPERRYVARLTTPAGAGGGAGAALKFYTRSDYNALRESMDVFVSEGPLRVPARIGRSKKFRMAASEWVAGKPLREALVEGQMQPESWQTVGAALAALHAQKSSKLNVFHTAASYAGLLAEAADAVDGITPDLGERARHLADRIGERLLKRHWRERRGIHGDLTAEQIILGEREATIVDFDRASRGDPRLDLGTLQARLVYDGICGAIDAVGVASSFETLLEEYRHAAGKDVTRKLSRFTAACLLRLAVEPFRHRHRDWPEEIESIVSVAEALVEQRVPS